MTPTPVDLAPDLDDGEAARSGTSMPVLPAPFQLQQFDRVTSTNDVACALAEGGAEHGTVVLATEQSAGRGRQGRSWVSGSGNLLCSLILRPDVSLDHAPQLSLIAGVAVAEALDAVTTTSLGAQLKWPNDVVINGRKVSGILLESRLAPHSALSFVVLGIGVNLASHPEETERPATSLAREGHPGITPLSLLPVLCACMGSWLAAWSRDGFSPVRDAWIARAAGLGGPIQVAHSREPLSGTFVGIDDSGALLLARDDGAQITVTAGDVSLLAV